MLKEIAAERFSFCCHGCGTAWTADYDLQHVEDGHGVTWEYYSLGGIPVTAPTARGSVSCPSCGASWLSCELVAVREVPLAEPPGAAEDRAWPRQRAGADRGRPVPSGEALR